MMVYRACMHYDQERGDVVFDFLKVAYPTGGRVLKMLGNPAVMRIMELNRKVTNEVHLFKGFVRFTELQGDILYSKIEPKCDVLTLLSPHFEQRFPEENWMIYDAKRMKTIVHPSRRQTVFVQGEDMEKLTKDMQYSDAYEDLWKVFFDTIGIDARYNPKCQQTLLPLWYRKNMKEFH